MELSSKLFNYKSKTFTAEASTLQLDRIPGNGLTIISAKTNRKADFFLRFVKRDREGDVQFWELAPSTLSLKRFPKLNGVKVLIFND